MFPLVSGPTSIDVVNRISNSNVMSSLSRALGNDSSPKHPSSQIPPPPSGLPDSGQLPAGLSHAKRVSKCGTTMLGPYETDRHLDEIEILKTIGEFFASNNPLINDI